MNEQHVPDESWDDDYKALWMKLQVSFDNIRRLRKALHIACERDPKKVYDSLKKADID